MDNVFDYIQEQEQFYQRETPVPITEGYDWSMAKHVRLTTLYLNSQFETGDQDDKPFMNIVLPKVNLQHRAVEFDLKDIKPYVNDSHHYWKSFLTRKFHNKWARENDLGEFFDEMTETYINYGGVIVKKQKGVRPVVVPFQRLAFADQTDLESGAICEKHYMNPAQLKEMESAGWGTDDSADMDIEELVKLAKEQGTQKKTDHSQQEKKTPTQYIEVYELHGILPNKYIEEDDDSGEFSRQMHIVAFYETENGKNGVTLFARKRKQSPYAVHIKDPIPGRALGRGAVEELFEPQVWMNYSAIQQKEILDQAAKVMYQTADERFAARNAIKDYEQGHIFTYQDGKPLTQVNNSAANTQAFENAMTAWNERAREISSAFESIQGDTSPSGTPFRLGALQNQEAHSLHEYRRKKLGQFTRKLYRDWFLPHFASEIRKEQEFLIDLELEEFENIAEQVATARARKKIKEKILAGKLPTEMEKRLLVQNEKDKFKRGGGKKFVKIAKDELKDLPLDVEVQITGQQKNTALMAEKLTSVLGQVARNPQMLQDPQLSRIFNEILEMSGISPVEFSGRQEAAPQQERGGGKTEELRESLGQEASQSTLQQVSQSL